MPPDIEDLVGTAVAGVDYFDPKEFEIRAQLEDEHYWHRHRREVLLRELRRVCPDRDRRLVELGCGAGTVATHFNAAGYQVDYGDIHAEGLEVAAARAARRLGPAVEDRRFFRIDITETAPPGDYEGIFLLDVIEHLPDDDAVLRNLRPTLAAAGKGSFLFVTVPAFQFLWSPWDDIEKHKRRYTAGSLAGLAERTGYRVVRSTYFFLPLFFAALGVKGLRTVRNAALGAPPLAQNIDELTETTSSPLLSAAVLRVLGTEMPVLRRAALPFGTSLLAVLEPA